MRGLPALPGLGTPGQIAAPPLLPARPRGASISGELELPPEDGVFDDFGVSFDDEDAVMTYAPAGGLAWLVYEREVFESGFEPDKFWVINNGKPHWVAVANYQRGIWELYAGKHTYYATSGSFKGSKTGLLHDWDEYLSPQGSLFLAVLSQDAQLTSGPLGFDVEYEPLSAPTGLHVESHNGGQLNIAWDSYDDPRDLRLELRYIQNDGPLKTRLLGEYSTSTTLLLYDETRFCIVAHWKDKGVYGPESAWVTDYK